MRKLTLFLAAVLMISLSGCAENRPSENNNSISNYAANDSVESDSNSSYADYSHLAEFEQHGLINAPSGQYVYGRIDPNDELAVYGIFRKTYNGYDLVIRLSKAGERPALFEDDFIYFFSYNSLIKYDLSAPDVEGSAEYIRLLPPMSNVTGIYYHDSDYLYVSGTLWDDENERSTAGEYYKIARDGSSYEEIAFEDIPVH